MTIERPSNLRTRFLGQFLPEDQAGTDLTTIEGRPEDFFSIEPLSNLETRNDSIPRIQLAPETSPASVKMYRPRENASQRIRRSHCLP